MSQMAVARLIEWLKKPAPPPPETAPAETGETHEQTPMCLTLPAGVFIGETPLKIGGETRETGETAQNSNLLNANAEATTPTAPAPAVTPGFVTPCDTTKQGLCHTDKTGVFIGETPPKTGAVTPVTPVTPQNSNLLKENAEATPTPAPDLRSALPTPAPAPALTSSNGGGQPRPRAWFHLESSWRVASKAWQTHRATCPTCMAADRTAASAGTGIRCAEGQRLHTDYEAALST